MVVDKKKRQLRLHHVSMDKSNYMFNNDFVVRVYDQCRILLSLVWVIKNFGRIWAPLAGGTDMTVDVSLSSEGSSEMVNDNTWYTARIFPGNLITL